MTSLESFEVMSGRRLSMASGVVVRAAGVIGSALSDFSDFGKLLVVVSGRPTNRYRGAATVTVETSSDGVSWTAAGSVTFGVAADQVVTVSSPDVYVRARASGLTGAWTFSVDVIPSEVNEPGGGAGETAGAAIVRAFPFAFDTSGILTGATIYTPTADDWLLDAWIEILTPWDGTTPKGDIGFFGAGDSHLGWFGFGTNGAIGMDSEDTTGALSNKLSSQAATPASLLSLSYASAMQGNFIAGSIARGLPAKFTDTTPVKVVVSQDGKDNGADPESSQGSAVAYLVTATPAT